MSSDGNTKVQERVRDVAVLCGGSLTNRTAASRSIAHMLQPKALAPDALERSKLIHRGASARVHADAFREVRTRLLALGGNGNFVTLVVAVSPGCGASFVARNIAAAFAFDEAKTALLIDCNLRYPAQHLALGVGAAHGGLIDYLEHPNCGIPHVLYGTGIPRLRLIPAGRPRESTAEYFSSYRMRALIDALRTRYPDRYIVMDGPALKGSPDARILSELADFVVIVAAYGRDTATFINQAAAGLDPRKVAGVVFNSPP